MKINTFKNMGDGDRVIRVLIGALLTGYTMGLNIEPLGWFSVLPLLAIPVVMTAIMGWDPLYSLANFSTSKSTSVTTLGFMASNLGKTDTIVRYVVGSAMLVATLLFSPVPIGLVALIPLAAAILILTSIAGWDPIYATFRLDTREQPGDLPVSVVIQGDFGGKDVPAEINKTAEIEHPKVA